MEDQHWSHREMKTVVVLATIVVRGTLLSAEDWSDVTTAKTIREAFKLAPTDSVSVVAKEA